MAIDPAGCFTKLHCRHPYTLYLYTLFRIPYSFQQESAEDKDYKMRKYYSKGIIATADSW